MNYLDLCQRTFSLASHVVFYLLLRPRSVILHSLTQELDTHFHQGLHTIQALDIR